MAVLLGIVQRHGDCSSYSRYVLRQQLPWFQCLKILDDHKYESGFVPRIVSIREWVVGSSDGQMQQDCVLVEALDDVYSREIVFRTLRG